jgi:hypothetical protein
MLPPFARVVLKLHVKTKAQIEFVIRRAEFK